MIKKVTVNEVLTPAGQVATAEAILGKVIAPPKSRWNPGSLAQAALSQIEAPCLLFLGSEILSVITFGTAAQSETAVAAVDSSLISAGDLNFVGAAIAGSSQRQRGVEFDYIKANVSLVDENGIALANEFLDFAQSVIAPSLPVFTASALLNKIDSYFQDREIPIDFVVLLNQFTGGVRVIETPDPTAGVFLNTLVGASGATVIASYDLAIPTPEDLPPASPTGPIWG